MCLKIQSFFTHNTTFALLFSLPSNIDWNTSGRAHEILGKVPDVVQISSGGVRAVAFEQEIGFHLFLKFSHGFPPGEKV
jgi:hypothetical protein